LIKGNQVLARTSIPLNPGQLVFFKVQQCAPQCILKLLELRHGQQDGIDGLLKKGAWGGFPFKFLTDLLKPAVASLEKSAPDDFPRTLWRLWDLLRRISLRPDEVIRPELLRSFVDGSGMTWEHKLSRLLLSGFQSRNQAEAIIEQDLKALALKLLADGGAQRLFSEQATARFPDGLEQLQLLNLSALEEKSRLLLTIPMQWHDRFAFAQLLIDLGDYRADGASENDENRVLKLSLFLEMSHLGPVRVDASVFQKEIRVGFLVCNEEIESFVMYYRPRLKQQLERHGFFLQQVTCRLEEPNTLANTCLSDAIIDLEEHYISLVI
jgi:hypothetical protein